MSHDLVIKNGTVVDGTGSPGYGADVAIDGEANIHQALDAVEAIAIDVFINAQGMFDGRVHHIAVGVGEIDVMLKKIDVGVDVSDDEQIGDLRIRIEEKRIARVVVQHDLIDLRQSHLAMHALPWSETFQV